MCRLFGYVARRPTSVIEALGREDFDAFTSLTAVHGDGWGMAWLDPDTPAIRSVTSADSAVRDPSYSELAEQRLSRAGIVHLRWATPGLPVSPENTHPFVDDGYAFAHNGHVAPVQRLEGMLDRDTRSMLRGDTDSERYFRFVLQCIAETGDDTEGLEQALGVLTSEFPDASLNALLMTRTRMYGVHINSHASAPVQGMRALFATEDEIPYRHTDEYFAMDYQLTSDTVQIISSGIDADGWTPVPEDTAASVDLATLEVDRLDGWTPARVEGTAE